MALAVALGLGASWAVPARAQSTAQQTGQPTGQQAAQPSAQQAAPGAPGAGAPSRTAAKPGSPGSPIVDESFAIRHDEDLYQLEELATLIAGSLNRVANKVHTLAINTFAFGSELDADFRAKAEVIILEKLLKANANVKLVQCQECQRLETRIVNGVLQMRKGIPSREARQELAKKLGVDGFLDVGVYRIDGQLSLYIKAIEAETGALILVDEIAGRKAAKRDAVTLSFGELNFPIAFAGKTYVHNALALTVTEQVQLTQRFSFGVDLIVYEDNNQLDTQPHLTLDTGILLSPFLGFDVVQLPQSTSRMLAYLGLGKLISPQLNYGDVYRAGLQFIVGDRLVVTAGMNQFNKTNVEVTSSEKNKQPLLANGAHLDGAGYELRFGYRF